MKINTKNTMSLVKKYIGKRQKGRYHGVKIGLVLGVLVSISVLVLVGCPTAVTNPVQQIIRDRGNRITPDPDTFGRVTRDSDNPQPTDLAVTVQLSSAEVSQGESVQITATVTNTSDHASNGHALLVFYKSTDAIVNPAILDVDLGYTISDSAVAAIEEALREGYGLDPVLSDALREQDLNEQNSVDANQKSVVDFALDPIFASVVVAPLASGGVFTLAEPINIPSTADVSDSYYGACVVLDRFNCKSAQLKVTTAQKPDVRAVDAPRFTNVPDVGYYTSGASATATATVRNAGGAAASNVMVTLYRVGNDTPIGTQPISSIAAGATATATFTFNVLEYTKKGTYTEQYYFQIAEIADEIDTENNRSDNNSLTVYVASNTRKFIDADGDLLIDIHNLDMLNNIRYNLEGTSYKTDNSANEERCLDISKSVRTLVACEGYELMRSLDFASVSSYGDEGYWDNADWRPNNPNPTVARNAGWPPIGGIFTAIFEGNGHTIRNLYARNAHHWAGVPYGLFSEVSGTVRNLTVEDSAIMGGDNTDYIGIVIAYLHAGGKVINVSVRRGIIDTGNAGSTRSGYMFDNLGHSGTEYYTDHPRISSRMDIAGGLVGTNAGTIAASSSAVLVIGAAQGFRVSSRNDWAYADKLGGLVGDNVRTGNIVASYSLSAVIGDDTKHTQGSSDRIGGIAGTNYGEILASYSLSNLNGQGSLDYIGGITGGLGYPPNVIEPDPNAKPPVVVDNPMVFSTYSTSVAYGHGVEGGIPIPNQWGTYRDLNCVGPITGYNYGSRTDIQDSYFFGKIHAANQFSNCPNDTDYRTNVGIDQLTGSNTGWATTSKYSGVSTRAWLYGGDRAAPALQYANYANHSGAEPDNNTSYANINYCAHLGGGASCGNPLPGQPLTDQGDTMGAAYSIDTPFYPGGGLSIPATIQSGGDKDYFKITVIKAGEIVIESSRSRGVDMQVQLLNSAGALVEYDDDDGEGNNFRIRRYIPRGEYTIYTYAHGNATGVYMISMQMID